jgi:limonene-1,2-epoxide hydrolase
MTHTERVLAFVAAWEARDVDAILSMMTPDARYLNVGLPEAVGHEAIRGFIAPFLAGAANVAWTVRHIGETADGTVLTERMDVFDLNGRNLEIPVMGVFEFRDNRICAWRDYFDVPAFQRQMGQA